MSTRRDASFPTVVLVNHICIKMSAGMAILAGRHFEPISKRVGQSAETRAGKWVDLDEGRELSCW